MPYRTTALIACAATLHAELATTCVESRALIERGQARRRLLSYPLLRQIAGGSDASLILAVITGVLLCVECIARQTGIPETEVDAALRTVARTLRLTMGPRRCDGCLQRKTTFSFSGGAALRVEAQSN
jgi:hypothetical protein